MIKETLASIGHGIKLTVIAGAILTTASLVIIGAKLPGWFGLANETIGNYQLDAREADLKRREDAMFDKREADLKQREQIIEQRAKTLASQTAEVQNELAKAKQEATKAEAARNDAIRAKKQALAAQQQAVSPPQIVQAVSPPQQPINLVARHPDLDKAAQFCGKEYSGYPTLIESCYQGYRRSPTALASLK